MRNRAKGSFLLAATRLMHEMEHVLKSNGVAWKGAARFDIRPYITAMLRLCKEQHLDAHSINHLRRVTRVIEALRGPVDLAEFKAGEENAVQYEQWLSSTFPKAFAEMRSKASERARKHARN